MNEYPLYILGCHSVIDEGPRDLDVYVGQEVTFSCTISTDAIKKPFICWKFKSNDRNSSYTDLHDQNENVIGNFFGRSQYTDGKNSTFRINTTELSDSGSYECYECSSEIHDAHKANATLIG